MGQGDASTVTMTFVGAGAISAEVSADIVGVRVVWGLDICQIFSDFVGCWLCLLFMIRNTTVLVRST